MQEQVPLYPILFTPIYKDYLWGSNRIARLFNRKQTPFPCAESWEITERPEGMGIVENGSFAGLSFEELIHAIGPERLFGKSDMEHFPLLIKIIDAAKLLSVQVHPGEAMSEALNGEPKTEMWYVLAASEGAYVYVGLKEGIDAAACIAALQSKDAPAVLNQLLVEKGDVIYIPAGTVHAIGTGCLILEVQQNSNTTYRLYDWDRVGADGAPRELHIEKGLKSIDPKAPWELTRVRKAKERAGFTTEKLIQSPYFNLDKLSLSAEVSLQSTGGPQIFFAEKGSTIIQTGREKTRLKTGRTAFVPAACANITLTPELKAAKASAKSPPSAVELVRICLP